MTVVLGCCPCKVLSLMPVSLCSLFTDKSPFCSRGAQALLIIGALSSTWRSPPFIMRMWSCCCFCSSIFSLWTIVDIYCLDFMTSGLWGWWWGRKALGGSNESSATFTSFIHCHSLIQDNDSLLMHRRRLYLDKCFLSRVLHHGLKSPETCTNKMLYSLNTTQP